MNFSTPFLALTEALLSNSHWQQGDISCPEQNGSCSASLLIELGYWATEDCWEERAGLGQSTGAPWVGFFLKHFGLSTGFNRQQPCSKIVWPEDDFQHLYSKVSEWGNEKAEMACALGYHILFFSLLLHLSVKKQSFYRPRKPGIVLSFSLDAGIIMFLVPLHFSLLTPTAN